MSDVKTTCRDINELHPVAQKACRLFLQECEEAGLNVLITETYRSPERQDYLYEQGRTRPGKVVTWTRDSRHESRMAWDICKNTKGHEYSDQLFFSRCGAIARKLGITWGGTWKTPDKPHFEVTKDWKYEEDEMVTKEKIEIFGKEVECELIRKGGKVYPYIRDFGEKVGLKISNKGKMPVVEKK